MDTFYLIGVLDICGPLPTMVSLHISDTKPTLEVNNYLAPLGKGKTSLVEVLSYEADSYSDAAAKLYTIIKENPHLAWISKVDSTLRIVRNSMDRFMQECMDGHVNSLKKNKCDFLGNHSLELTQDNLDAIVKSYR